MGNGLAFALGLGSGILQSKQRAEDKARLDEDRARQDEDRAMRKQLFDAQMEEINRGKGLHSQIQSAAAPMKVTEVTDIDPENPAAVPKKSWSLSDGRVLGTQGEADAAAAEYNKPEAQVQRVANAYIQGGAPEKGLGLADYITDRKRSDQEWGWKMQDRQKRIMDEAGVYTAKALLTGDANAVFSAYNAQGNNKLRELPTVTRGPAINIPGFEHVPNYIYTGTVVGTDGKERTVRVGSHDANMALMQYPEIVKQYREGAKFVAEGEYKTGMLGAAQTNAQANMIRAQRGDEGSGGKPPSGYRWSADGTRQEVIPGGPADKPSKGMPPLQGAVLKKLTEVRDASATMNNLSSSFKDDFARKGVLGVGAEGSLSAKSVLGTDKNTVDWWKNYRKQVELVERHELFGAALTPHEQDSWRSADIGPGMDAAVIRRNLETRATLSSKVLENARQDFIDAGHSEDRVNAIAGRVSVTPANQNAGGQAVPVPRVKSQLKAGTVYMTGQGPAKWNGTSFEVQ